MFQDYRGLEWKKCKIQQCAPETLDISKGLLGVTLVWGDIPKFEDPSLIEGNKQQKGPVGKMIVLN